ncbi:MAG: hypothetical protein OXS32_09245, partial [Verrucomicrobiales bacterium]|nr:hypothetical protein [Verrucomicrobiales bacterium]
MRGVQLRLAVAAAKNLRGKLTHERHPRLSADENHLIKIFSGLACIGQCLETILACARDHRLGQALEL